MEMVSTKKLAVAAVAGLLVTAVVTASRSQSNKIPVPRDVEKAVLTRLAEIQSACSRPRSREGFQFRAGKRQRVPCAKRQALPHPQRGSGINETRIPRFAERGLPV